MTTGVVEAGAEPGEAGEVIPAAGDALAEDTLVEDTAAEDTSAEDTAAGTELEDEAGWTVLDAGVATSRASKVTLSWPQAATKGTASTASVKGDRWVRRGTGGASLSGRWRGRPLSGDGERP